MQQFLKEVIMISFILVMVISCYWSDTLYHQYRKVGDGWTREDTLSFVLPSLPTDCSLHLAVDIRYTDKFPYRYLWLQIRHNLKDSLFWQTDTLRCAMFDEAGHPLGEGIAGIYQLEVPFKNIISVDNLHGSIKINHCLVDDYLNEIMDVGINIVQQCSEEYSN